MTAVPLVLACPLAPGGTATAQAKPRFLNPPPLPPSRGYTQVVEIPTGSRLLYISGQVPLDSAGNLELLRRTGDQAEAERGFRRALDLARTLRARTLALRAAASLESRD